MDEKKNKVVRRAVAWISGTVLLTAFLLFWIHVTEGEARYAPEYPKVDISGYLKREKLTEEDYQLLYQQTGLSSLAVDALRAEGREEEMLALQERFFAEAEICCERDFLLYNEVLELEQQTEIMPALEDGDILITFNSHFLGWRNGHAAIVIDAAKGKTLEAISLGTESAILSVSSWEDRPSFAVLRLSGASREKRAAIADYAKGNLVKQPYRLTAGIFGEMGKGTSAGTNCSHLVWQAYNEFGYNLDSDGGIIVTPKDLYESSLLEVVQVYGMKPM